MRQFGQAAIFLLDALAPNPAGFVARMLLFTGKALLRKRPYEQVGNDPHAIHHLGRPAYRRWMRSVGSVAVVWLLLTLPARSATCQHQPGSGSWSWREVDGQRCWYEGRKVLPKGDLHWPFEAAPKLAPPAASPSWLERVSDQAPPAEIYFLSTVNGRDALETYPALTWQQPWLSPDTIMNWPLLLDIDRVPFATWDKRIGQ